jgi:hypothetical protein
VRLSSPYVKPAHARLFPVDGGIGMEDLGSTNGKPTRWPFRRRGDPKDLGSLHSSGLSDLVSRWLRAYVPYRCQLFARYLHDLRIGAVHIHPHRD